MSDNLKKAIARILQAAQDAGKKTGMFCTSGEQSKVFADMGFHLISVSADMYALPVYFTDAFRKAKGEASN